MKIILDPRKTLIQNAALYHEEAKKFKSKSEGAARAILETLKSIDKLGVENVAARKAQWFEKFHFFKTSKGTLVVGGRNAKQNDLVFSKHAVEGEFFLHADIRGSPAVIIKSVSPSEKEFQEAAQFTASYSGAWKRGFGSIDVYAVSVKNVSKHSQGGYLGQGAFAIAGERKWFKNTLLGLYICMDLQTFKLFVQPLIAGKTELCIEIKPGGEEKLSVSKAIKAYFAKKLFEQGKRVKFEGDEITRLLPGNCEMGVL